MIYPMKKKIVSLTLSPALVESIDKSSQAFGMNRSEYVEMMLMKGFHFSDEVQSGVKEISKLQDFYRDKIITGD